jgi:hypothetical protein
MACGKGYPTTATKVYVIGDGNTTNVSTGGSAAGSAPCAAGANTTTGTDPNGNPAQSGTNSPDCSAVTGTP